MFDFVLVKTYFNDSFHSAQNTFWIVSKVMPFRLHALLL